MKEVYRNATVLSVANVVGYIIPLLEVPILARALGPESYGMVVLFQSIALISSLIVEYGFNLSAARQVALAKNDPILLGRIFSDVFLAKIILSFLVMVALFALSFTASAHRVVSNFEMLAWSAAYFVAFGFSPFWFFQGREQLTGVIVLEFCLRLIGLSLLFVLIKSDQDAVLALAIMSAVGLTNTVLSTWWCFREVASFSISLGGAIKQISQGFYVFLYRSSNNILLNAAPPVLGYTVGPSALAVFVPAEKVVRGVVGFVAPVLTALFPYFSRIYAEASAYSLRHAWLIICCAALGGAVAATILSFYGPLLLNVVLGSQYALAEKLLCWFVWIIPLRMTNQALGMVLLIPARRDKAASSLLMIFSMLSLVLGGGLSTQFGVRGMVIGFIAAEAMLTISLLVVSRKVTSEFVLINLIPYKTEASRNK